MQVHPGTRIGGACPNLTVDRLDRIMYRNMRILHADLMRVFGLLMGLRNESCGAVADPGQRIHIHRRAFERQTIKQLAGGFPAGQRNAHRSDHRAVVQSLPHFEHVRAGSGIAGPNGTLHGGCATPLRQIGKMQVVPA